MGLTGLPQEILDMILSHLDSHGDLYALARTCRILYPSCATTKLAFHPDFRKDRYTLPRHHAFLTNIVTQLADWAVKSLANRDWLQHVLCDGLDSLLLLATKVA